MKIPKTSMGTLVDIRLRRSVRSYLPEKIGKGRINALLTAATWAPTAMHAEPWGFVIVQDSKIVRKLSERGKSMLKERGRHENHEHDKKSLQRFTDPEFNIFYDASTLIIICGKTLSSFVQADCWLAAENLMLSACAYGLGTCVIGLAVDMLQDPQVKALLRIPTEVTAIAPIILGRPRGETPITSRKKPLIFSWK